MLLPQQVVPLPHIESRFATESFIGELAIAAQADPAKYRLRQLKSGARLRELPSTPDRVKAALQRPVGA